MSELGNNEFLMCIFLILVVALFACILGLIFKRFGPKIQKWLDSKIEAMPKKYVRKRELLEVEYRTYSTDDLLEALQKIYSKRASHNAAIFNVSRTRMEDERVRQRIQQLQSSKYFLTRQNADFVMRDYFEKQYADCKTENLLDLLDNLEGRNDQEVEALLAISLARIEDRRVRQRIHQLLSSIDRKIKFNAELMIKEYFEKQNTDDTTENLLDLLQNIEDRDKQEVAVLFTIASGRMQDKRVNLCIDQLQNSKKLLVRKQARQIMKDYMA